MLVTGHVVRGNNGPSQRQIKTVCANKQWWLFCYRDLIDIKTRGNKTDCVRSVDSG